MTDMTSALIVTRHGGPETLQIADVELPAPGPGQARVEIMASGVNFIDVYHREGVYPTEPPFVLGVEGVGVVQALSDDVEDVGVGQRVAWAGPLGSHAGAMNIKADTLVPVPDGISDTLAAALPLQGMTAHYLVNSTYQVKPGDNVIVHAAAGGVGQLLTQLAKAAGAHVIGVASTPEKAEKAKALGADAVLGYDALATAELFANHVRELTDGVGAQVVYDGVGQATFDASLAALAPRGTLALFGAASGQVPPFDLQRLNTGGSLFVTRPTLGHYVATRSELLWRAEELFDAVQRGRLSVEIGGSFALADAASAYNRLEGRRSTGKLLLTR